MNWIEKALIHPHHNTDRLLDFGAFKKLNDAISADSPTVIIGPNDNDDAGVGLLPGTKTMIVLKTETHNTPSAVTPYDSAATCASGTFRDIIAMGARPIFALDLIGGPPPDALVLVGPCALKGDGKQCECGKCIEMKNYERNNLMVQGLCATCLALGVPILGGGITTSIQGPIPLIAVVGLGALVTDEPLTKPAKDIGDCIILVGETGNDGNDTVFRAGYANEMSPAIALFKEERTTMDAMLAIFATGKAKACSDLGAAGIGAAVCESARQGNRGAQVELKRVPLKAASEDISPEGLILNETQARFIVQVDPKDVDAVLDAACRAGGTANMIGRITDRDVTEFRYDNVPVATIPNHPSEKCLKMLRGTEQRTN